MKEVMTIIEIRDKAENLKQYIWGYFFLLGITHKGAKDAMNELLDCLEECPQYCDKED